MGSEQTIAELWAASVEEWRASEVARLTAEVGRLRGAIALALEEVCCNGPLVILRDALAREDAVEAGDPE